MTIQVEVVENGFVVTENNSRKTWAFESAATLGDFMELWGKGKHPDKDQQRFVHSELKDKPHTPKPGPGKLA